MADVPANNKTTAVLETATFDGAMVGTYSGRFETTDDHDWIKVTLTAGKTYFFYLSSEEPGLRDDDDPQFTLWNAAGTAVAFADDGGVGSNTKLTFVAPTTGTYYIDASLAFGRTRGTYSVLVTDLVLGSDTLLTKGHDVANASIPFEWLIGGGGSDHLDLVGLGYAALGEQGNDILFGNDTANMLSGGLGDDHLIARNGNDLLFGDAGDDFLDGGAGDDRMFGGDGFDHLRGFEDNDQLFGGADDDLLEGGSGNDTLRGGAGADILIGDGGNDVFQIAGSEGVGDTFAGGAGTDKIQVLGTGAVTLSGFNAAASSIEQWSGNGKGIGGTSAADKFDFSALSSASKMGPIDGKGGNDTIIGSKAADTIIGGLGKDILTGGAGKDKFDFNSIKESVKGSNRDQIKDFKHGQGDRIDLRDIDANTKKSGNQNFKFIGDDKFSKTPGELRFKSDLVQGDVNGDGKADFEIKVVGDNLVKGDFIL